MPLIRENKFREIYQKFSICENFFREINLKYPFAKIISAKNDIFPKKFSGTRIVFYIINGSKSKQIQNRSNSNYTILIYIVRQCYKMLMYNKYTLRLRRSFQFFRLIGSRFRKSSEIFPKIHSVSCFIFPRFCRL